MAFWLCRESLEPLLKSCHVSGLLDGRDFNRVHEMFGKDWRNADPDDPDVEAKDCGDDTPLGAPICKKLAMRKQERESVCQSPK